MKVSGFTFIRNGQLLGYPFIQSIRSALPVVDEFIVAVGQSEDDTLAMIRSIGDPKIKIIETVWNPHIQSKGFILAQQKMIAQYACTGEWALYIEGDELLHEDDYEKLRGAMRRHRDNPKVEALVFDYLHFYGNLNTIAWSPKWYRRAPRVIKTSARNYAPDGLFWLVLDGDNKKARYPYAALANATMYHYGHVRTEAQETQKQNQLASFYGQSQPAQRIDHGNIDPQTLRPFMGSHPAILGDFFPKADGPFQADPQHVPTKKERKNRLGLKLERWFGLDLSHKHFTLITK